MRREACGLGGRAKAERTGSFDWTFGLELKRATTLVTLNKRLIMQNILSSEIRERDRLLGKRCNGHIPALDVAPHPSE